MFIARNVKLYLVLGVGRGSWAVSIGIGMSATWTMCLIVSQDLSWGRHEGSIVNFSRVDILRPCRGDLSVFLGVNILSFAAEGESIYVHYMCCLLIGCGDACPCGFSSTTCKSNLLQRQAWRVEME